MILTPFQNVIAADTHRFRVVNVGRRAGKTTLAIEEIKGKALSKPARIAYIAPTFQQARDIAWQQLKAELAPIIINVNESRLEIRTRTAKSAKEESIIMLRGWEAIETLRGQYFDFIVIDEIASMRGWKENWEEVIRPTLTDKKGEALFISTPKGFNHFYELYNKENDPDGGQDYKSFHFTSFENPHIPPDELETARKEMTEDRFAQEYLADFRKTEGLVYKEFDRRVHLFSDLDEIVGTSAYIAGVDFGFTNPTAIVDIKKDFDNTYYVTREFYKTNQTNDSIAEYVAAQKYHRVYPDPEAPSSIEELRRKKVNLREVLKNKDSIKDGIDTVRELFKANRLKIHASCSNLIWELETYSYPEKKPGQNEYENPIKEGDHAVDALRYALSMEELSATHRIAHQYYPKH